MWSLPSGGNICRLCFYFEDEIPRTLHPPQQNYDGGPRGRPGCLSFFSHPGRAMPPTTRFCALDDDELHVAHTYVLMNCEGIGPYLEYVHFNIVYYLIFIFNNTLLIITYRTFFIIGYLMQI